MMNKYHNRKVTTFDGIEHASQKEANRWCELKLLERAGKITDLDRQVKFTLIPAQYEEINEGKKPKKKLVERECSYIADFVYLIADNGKMVVEDTKGFKTKDYVIKRKLMRYIHKVAIKEV
jgi:hypothetical protein